MRATNTNRNERNGIEKKEIIVVRNLPIAVKSDGGVSQNSQHETDGRSGVAIDTEEATLFGVLPARARDDDEISRPSWMHRLQFHGLKAKHEDKVSDYSRCRLGRTI